LSQIFAQKLLKSGNSSSSYSRKCSGCKFLGYSDNRLRCKKRLFKLHAL